MEKNQTNENYSKLFKDQIEITHCEHNPEIIEHL